MQDDTTSIPADESGDTSTSGSVHALPVNIPLTLDDFFQPSDGWAENRYNVANKDQIRGIAATVDSCSDQPGYSASLELRLQDKYQRLTFDVAESNDSEDSSQILMTEVIANGHQANIQRTPFNKIRHFSIPVADVNALQIRYFLDDGQDNCGAGSINAVLIDPQLH